jgi:hypothetical protein
MNTRPWIISGLALIFVWPFAGILTAFAYDAPTVPTFVHVFRTLLYVTLWSIPVIWTVALILSILEGRKQRRAKLLKRYAIVPYIAACAHLLVWIGARTVIDWP